ncbi:spaetzle-processing enzyme [Drosophila sechellia]|uniref:CLIP domain-containing serine protease n=1 Tax=Drosophila sechellia TaxID=7238 RepID=B4HFW0_DROSE|nr:spaetzle-processing enzyme [Drosophila sechellia]EDW43353.1 GM26514 [Drosophila sechellia]
MVFLQRLYLSFLLLHTQLLMHLVSASASCNPGEKCISLANCTSLLPFLKPHIMTPAERAVFEGRQCGFDSTGQELVNRVQICCPEMGHILPNNSICGPIIPTFRIIGGYETQPNEMPWMALILYAQSSSSVSNERLVPKCSGSLITNRYVLTAAHCLKITEWDLRRVRLGEHNILSNPDCFSNMNGVKQCAPRHLEIDIDQRIEHEQYMVIKQRHYNDIALLRLKFPVRFTDEIKPICVQHGYMLSNPSFSNHKLGIAGWGFSHKEGYSNVLLKAQVDGRNTDECSLSDPYLGFDKETQICAGFRGGNDTCKGDSGGPLMARGNGYFVYLAGITSYGYSECGSGPAAYTRTSKFIKWIQWKMYTTRIK